MLPLKPIKKILKQDCHFQISADALYIVRDFLEELIVIIGIQAVRELEGLNEYRKIQGLEPLRRLSSMIVNTVVADFIKPLEVTAEGSQTTIENPGGHKMINKKNATKSAETTDDNMEAE